MAGVIKDLKNFDVILTGTFGVITLRTYGVDGVNAEISVLEDNKLYNVKVGANGDAIFNKTYKSLNQMLKVRTLRYNQDYISLQGLVALEQSGQSNQFSILAKDNASTESFFSASCILMEYPNYQNGTDVDGNAEYTFVLSSCIHTPPTSN